MQHSVAREQWDPQTSLPRTCSRTRKHTSDRGLLLGYEQRINYVEECGKADARRWDLASDARKGICSRPSNAQSETLSTKYLSLPHCYAMSSRCLQVAARDTAGQLFVGCASGRPW